MTLKKLLTIITVTTSLIISGCVLTQTAPADDQANPLTHGNVQLTLKNGVTTKTDVLEAFGAPNITTIDATGREVWTYQKHATVANSSSSESYATVILFGGSKKASGFQQSSRTMTLIIKFNDADVVDDFRSRSSSF